MTVRSEHKILMGLTQKLDEILIMPRRNVRETGIGGVDVGEYGGI